MLDAHMPCHRRHSSFCIASCGAFDPRQRLESHLRTYETMHSTYMFQMSLLASTCLKSNLEVTKSKKKKHNRATNAFLHLTIELKRWRLHVGPTYVGRRHASGFKSGTNLIWDLTFPWKFKQAHCRSHRPINAMGRLCESTTPHRRSSPTQWRSPSCW